MLSFEIGLGSFSEEHMSSTPKQLLKSESFAGIGTSLDESPIFVQEKGEDGYRCPLENCRKLFRRDNLLVVFTARESNY